MKTSLVLLSMVSVLILAGCTVKVIQPDQAPSGASYHQQNQSADKAFKELDK